MGPALLAAARHYHERQDWYCRLFLLMPDHCHALIAPAPDRSLAKLIGDWKRFTSSSLGLVWQKNFIDHRLRSDESWDAKVEYIISNPVRAGLLAAGETWPYFFER